MNFRKFSSLVASVALALLIGPFGSTSASAQVESGLYSFQSGSDGAQPVGGVIEDDSGNLYGTTSFGGAGGAGTVFELVRPETLTGSWTEKVLYTFLGGSDGAYPFSKLAMDDEGNLYGTTFSGGASTACAACGTVFELVRPKGSNHSWTEDQIYVFDGVIGAYPTSGLVIDATGNLYGTTFSGGATGAGTVFELSRPRRAAPGVWTLQALYTFSGTTDGTYPFGGITRGPDGAFYGAAIAGGANGYGDVYQLKRPTKAGGDWRFNVLYSFANQTDGAEPVSSVILDDNGRVYGTTSLGGNANCGGPGCGTVFELLPPSVSGGAWTESTLYIFLGGTDGAEPFGGLVRGRNGRLVGTASIDGLITPACPAGCGTIFELMPSSSKSSATWSETTLYSFSAGTDGATPEGGLFLDDRGSIYGTTVSGGDANEGVVFQIAQR